MIFNKTPFEILSEAVLVEGFEVDNLDNGLDEDEIQGEFEDTFADVEELEDDITYTEEMVHVIEQNTSSGTRYLVEMDNLAKYMQSNMIVDPVEAITKIAECNSLDSDKMCVVIESDDYAIELLEEAKKHKKSTGTKSKTKEIKSSLDVINMMKTKGIKVVKKKSKGKPKKRKK